MIELGTVASGVVRTFRYYRGTEIVSNKAGEITVERLIKGGICFFFEIDYNKKELLFTASITRDDEQFCKRKGREICAGRAKTDPGRTFKIPFDDTGSDLMEHVFNMLLSAQETGELGDKPFLRTLLRQMMEYDTQNAETAEMYQDLLETGQIVIPE